MLRLGAGEEVPAGRAEHLHQLPTLLRRLPTPLQPLPTAEVSFENVLLCKLTKESHSLTRFRCLEPRLEKIFGPEVQSCSADAGYELNPSLISLISAKVMGHLLYYVKL